MTTVVNRNTHVPTPNDVNIMRPGFWGNPFRIGVDGTREVCIAKHLDKIRHRLTREPHFLSPLRGKNLVCCCAPLPCHGDNYVKLLREQDGVIL